MRPTPSSASLTRVSVTRHRDWLSGTCAIVTSFALLASCSSSASDSEQSLPPPPTVATTAAPVPTASPTLPPTTVAVPTTTTTTTTTTRAPTVPPTSATTAAATVPPTAATVLELSATGVGLSSFQADPDQSIQYISSILGAPTSDSGWVDAATSPFGVCPGTSVRGVRWGDLLLLYGDLAAADGVRAFFGYSLGSTTRPATGKPGAVRTANGITLGSTVAAVRTAFPDASIVDGTPPTFDLGGSGVGGTISDISQTGVVTSIYGGTGCTS